jgi:hypothetical protein
MGAAVFFESTSELAQLSNTFTVNGVPTDPTTVTLTVTTPSGVATDYTGGALVHTGGAGVYSKDVTCSEPASGSTSGSARARRPTPPSARSPCRRPRSGGCTPPRRP